MDPRHHLNDPRLILRRSFFFVILDVRGRSREKLKGSGPRPATALIPSERSSKTMVIHVEFDLIHGFHVEISGIEGVPGL